MLAGPLTGDISQRLSQGASDTGKLYLVITFPGCLGFGAAAHI